MTALIFSLLFADVSVTTSIAPERGTSAMPMLMMTERENDRVVVYWDGRVLFEVGRDRIMEARTSLNGLSRAGLHRRRQLLYPKLVPHIVSWDEKGENMTIDVVDGPSFAAVHRNLRALRNLPAREWRPDAWSVLLYEKELPADWPAEWSAIRESPLFDYWYYIAYARGASEETLRAYHERHPSFKYRPAWPHEHLWRYVPGVH
jgi:hypothetical protein